MGWMWAEIWADTDFRLPKRANFPRIHQLPPNGAAFLNFSLFKLFTF